MLILAIKEASFLKATKHTHNMPMQYLTQHSTHTWTECANESLRTHTVKCYVALSLPRRDETRQDKTQKTCGALLDSACGCCKNSNITAKNFRYILYNKVCNLGISLNWRRTVCCTSNFWVAVQYCYVLLCCPPSPLATVLTNIRALLACPHKDCPQIVYN